LPVWRSSATINSALTCAFINAAANWIGDVTADSPALKALAHALGGCAAGAVVGELAAKWTNSTGNPEKSQ
jgi:hypothetical protein